MVMNNPGRAAVALAKRSCIASVVLPEPGPPATRLNESAGTPPPSTSFNPGTPVLRTFRVPNFGFARFRASNLAIVPCLPLDVHDFGRARRADLLHQSDRHLLSDDAAQQLRH